MGSRMGGKGRKKPPVGIRGVREQAQRLVVLGPMCLGN
jgi:hypothetical protein